MNTKNIDNEKFLLLMKYIEMDYDHKNLKNRVWSDLTPDEKMIKIRWEEMLPGVILFRKLYNEHKVCQ